VDYNEGDLDGDEEVDEDFQEKNFLS